MLDKIELKKYFPWCDKDFIELQQKIFLKTIKNISKETWIEIKELVFEKIEKNLKIQLPFMTEEILKILFKWNKEKTEEEKLKEDTKNIINKKTNYNILKPKYLDNKDTFYEFIKTANSFWVWDKFNETSWDLENYSEENSKKNHLKNYKDFIWQKLLLTKEEIKNSSLTELDLKMWKYLNSAKQHVFKVMKNFNWEKDNFKSKYFNTIHKTDSIFGLFKKYYELEKDKNIIKNKIKQWKDFQYWNELDQILIWKFEIQRLFALNSLYINREFTLNHKHVEEEKDFLIWKIKDLWTKSFTKDIFYWNTTTDNELYNYTKEKDIFWKKLKNWKYIFSETKKEWFNKITLNTYEIEWRERRYQKERESIKIHHIWNRISKNSFSTVEKFLRKWHNSFNEILDHKWFIFVVDDYKNKWKKLLKILENRLWTLRTSWAEEPVFMSENWNENSNSEYNSLKWILKISYKWKKIGWFFKDIKNEIKNSNNHDLKKITKELWDVFWNKKYFIETELQIFDLENYIKAEIDETSEAYHWNYKEYQQVSNIPLYFPKEIYWEEKLKLVIENSLKKIRKI